MKLISQSLAGAEDVKFGSVGKKKVCDALKNEERRNYSYLHLCHLAGKTQRWQQREWKEMTSITLHSKWAD